MEIETCTAAERGHLRNEYEGRTEASDYRSTRPNKMSFVKVEGDDRFMVLRWPNAAAPFYTGEPGNANPGRVDWVRVYSLNQDQIDEEARRALEELGWNNS